MELYDSEEQQVEAIKDWWKENGKAVILGTVVGIGGLLGWRFYQDSVIEAQEAASDAYTTAVTQLAAQGADAQDTVQSFITANSDSEYATLAALQLAKVQVEADELDAALEQLNWAKSNSKDTGLTAVATYRVARVLVEQGKDTEALSELDALTHSDWAGRVAELRGDILLRSGDKDAAYQAYSEAQQSTDNSQTLQMKLDDLAK
ncbi:YfgM family protein [Vibrio agarivorans]|uniref:Ancillary SecYEG translocon subunit n=1 Tax=Vibrio agarivorans TaxID=153622 RepID=A0ABT7Y1L8_9VIBR|nr:YfgM family protein [Vibrio agarivorans]MDN2481931.1 YfgM family protein [Vibrio agarivorans]